VDPSYHQHAASQGIARSLSLVLEASQDAREARSFEVSTQLEHLAEELIYLRRQLLDLPPQRSTTLQDREEDVPW
jgi:hypothetical protein